MSIVVACAAEGAEYLEHTATMLRSLRAQHPDAEVHLLPTPETPDLPGTTVHRVADERVAGLPTEGFTGKATWYRAFLPELLPDTERILFLDSDLLVLAPLDELWTTSLDDAWVAAVDNVFQPDHRHHPGRLGVRRYFNAGVLLMNLATMRRDDRTTALVEYGRTADYLPLRDQDALNVVLGERRVALPARFNVMNSHHAFSPWWRHRAARRAPVIRHFEGPGANKPWHPEADPTARELWARFAAD